MATSFASIHIPEIPPAQQIEQVDAVKEVTYSELILASREMAHLRMTRLLKLRNVFGVLAVVFLVLTIAFVVLRISYEPAAALFACTMGTFLVFVMKVKDGSK